MPGLIETQVRFIPWGLGPQRGMLQGTAIYQLNSVSSTSMVPSQLTRSDFSSGRRPRAERPSARTRVPSSIILHVMVFHTASSPEFAQPSDELFLDDEGFPGRMVSAVVTFEVGPNRAQVIYSDLQRQIVTDSRSRPHGTVTYWHWVSSRPVEGPTVYEQLAATNEDQDVLPQWITMDPSDDVIRTYQEVEVESRILARLICDCAEVLNRHVPLLDLNVWGHRDSHSRVSFLFRTLA